MTAPPAAPSALSPADPRAVGPYTLVGRLGQGGMGVVYLGVDSDDHAVAIKLVKSEVADQPQFRARFAHEVQAARAVGGQYTARLIDADTTASPQWVATEYVPGPTLADHIDTHGPMPKAQVRLLGLGLAEAVDAVHAAGLIHRDLKPSNIILSPTGPKVIDFGISQTSDATSLTQTGVYLGSLAWMSPEQVTGTPLTPASDMFSLGLLLAYAALGRHPYGDGRPEALAFRTINQVPDLTGLPPSLQGVCGQLLSRTPGERPTPDTVVTTLTDGATHIHDITRVMGGAWDATFVDSHTVAAPTTPGLLTAPPPRGRRRLAATIAVGAAVIAAAAALATGWVLLPRSGATEAAPPPTPRQTPTPAQPATATPAISDSATPRAATQAASYPVLGVSPLQVREGPYLAYRPVGEVPPGDEVQVVCTAQGDAVTQDNGIDNRQWNYITAPFTGYVPDAFIDAGGVVAPQPTCEATFGLTFLPPPPAAESPAASETFVVESENPGNDFFISTDRRYAFTVLDDPYRGLGLLITDPGTGLEYAGFPDQPLFQPLGESLFSTRLLGLDEVAARIDEVTALEIPVLEDHPLNPRIRVVTSPTAATVVVDPAP